MGSKVRLLSFNSGCRNRYLSDQIHIAIDYNCLTINLDYLKHFPGVIFKKLKGTETYKACEQVLAHGEASLNVIIFLNYILVIWKSLIKNVYHWSKHMLDLH